MSGDHDIVPGPVDPGVAASARWREVKEIVAIIALSASGVALAYGGFEQVAGTVFGALAMMIVPGNPPVPRSAMMLLGAMGGALVGGLVA